MTNSLSDDWIVIGRIVAPQGLDGSVRVYPDSDFPQRFLEPGDRWLLKPRQPQPEAAQLLSGRFLPGKGLYVLKFAGVNYRDQAEALRETELVIPAGDRLELEPDEFHVADLVGLAVRLQSTGMTIGTVVDIYTAGNDLLAVQLADEMPPSTNTSTKKNKAKTTPILVPFVHEIVPEVNLAQQYVVIDPPKGLLPFEPEQIVT